MIGTTYDGVVDRINKYLFLVSGRENNYFISKILLNTHTLVQTRKLSSKPFGPVYADQEFFYYLINKPNAVNTTLARFPIDDISGEPETLELQGLVKQVGPRPDPRDGFNSEIDLVAYYTGPKGLLQRTSTRAYNVIPAIPIREDKVILWVQNGFAYDIFDRDGNKVVSSFTFLTSSLNATGNEAVVGASSDLVHAIQEDRYQRGSLHLKVADNKYLKLDDGSLNKSNQFNLENAAGILPRVDNNKLHYVANHVLYVYDVTNGNLKKTNINNQDCPPCPCGEAHLSGDNNA
ncbi:hypothetical protein AKO1_006917, partial [Acrasis kona]